MKLLNFQIFTIDSQKTMNYVIMELILSKVYQTFAKHKQNCSLSNLSLSVLNISKQNVFEWMKIILHISQSVNPTNTEPQSLTERDGS